MTNSPSGAAALDARTTSQLQRFTVAYEFPVCFTRGLFEPSNRTLVDTLCRLEPAKRHRCLVFLDAGVGQALPSLAADIAAYAKAHAEKVELIGEVIPVPGGEAVKNDLHFVEQMQRRVYERHIDRHSFIIAIGGGAVLDAVGLVAATSHRGVRLIRVPTTVLSQNDSGVGVKNSVNLFGVKNFVGTFAPPFAVLADFAMLDALPAREKTAGLAEAVKVALIRDRDFFVWLEANSDALALHEPDAMAYMIRRCAELHMRQIAHGGDPFESGSARPLDFGHWAAHKLESITAHHVRHGEAVAIGMALDSRYAVLRGHLAAGAEERICALLEHLGFRLWHPGMKARDDQGGLRIIAGLREFREHLGGELTITLLNDVGVGIEVHEMDEARILDALDWLEARANSR